MLDTNSNTRWILDTGATGHMCTNRALLHAYRELAWGQTRRGFTGANGQVAHLVGVGDVTLDAAVPPPSGGSSPTAVATAPLVQRFTLSGVHFYPTHGVNILSWSALKRAAAAQGVRLRLVEGSDASLRVVLVEGRLKGRETERLLMRFRQEGGLFVLDQPEAKETLGRVGDA